MDLSCWVLGAISLGAAVGASYTDLRTFRVPNFITFGLLVLGTFAHLMRVLLGEQSLLFVLSLFFVSGTIAFALYRFGFMGAGDAKLLWGFCLVVPPAFFLDAAGRPIFPPVVLMVNLFGVYFFGMLGYLLVKSSAAQKWQVIATFPWHETPKRFVELIGFIGFAAVITAGLLRWFPATYVRLGTFLRLVLILTLFLAYQKAALRHPVSRRYWLLPIVVSFLIVLRWSGTSLAAVFNPLLALTGLYLLAFFLFRMFFIQLGFQLLSREVKITDLQPGALPAEAIWRVKTDAGEVYLKSLPLSRPPLEETAEKTVERIVTPRLNGLDAEQIRCLKALAEEGAFESFGNVLRIQTPQSFAPIISLGVVVTLIFRGAFYNNPVLGTLF